FTPDSKPGSGLASPGNPPPADSFSFPLKSGLFTPDSKPGSGLASPGKPPPADSFSFPLKSGLFTPDSKPLSGLLPADILKSPSFCLADPFLLSAPDSLSSPSSDSEGKCCEALDSFLEFSCFIAELISL